MQVAQNVATISLQKYDFFFQISVVFSAWSGRKSKQKNKKLKHNRQSYQNNPIEKQFLLKKKRKKKRSKILKIFEPFVKLFHAKRFWILKSWFSKWR